MSRAVSLGVFAVLLLGAIFPDRVEQLVAKITSGVSRESPETPQVEIDPAYRAAAERAVPAFAANKLKAQAFRGYFAALAQEVRESEYLKTTADIEQLFERATDRFNAVLQMPAVNNGAEVAKAIEDVMAVGMSLEIEPLDQATREGAAKGFEALEWAVQEASK